MFILKMFKNQIVYFRDNNTQIKHYIYKFVSMYNIFLADIESENAEA